MNNRNIPDLKVSREYSDLLRGYADNKESMSADSKNAVLFVKQKLDSARWFIDAIKQRQDTLQRTMQAIMDMQYDFFLTGDEAQLKPMILKDVAQRTGYDISTISRVSNSKYVQTNFGIYPLKYFFSESMQTDTGRGNLFPRSESHIKRMYRTRRQEETAYRRQAFRDTERKGIYNCPPYCS